MSDAPFDWITLEGDEEILWQKAPHPVVLVPALGPVLGLVVLALAAVAVGQVLELPEIGAVAAGGLGGLAAALLLWAEIKRRYKRYVITSAEVYEKAGVFSRDVTQLPLENVQNTSYDQSLFDRIFSLGTVEIYSAGSGTIEIVFESVPDPDAATSILSREIT